MFLSYVYVHETITTHLHFKNFIETESKFVFFITSCTQHYYFEIIFEVVHINSSFLFITDEEFWLLHIELLWTLMHHGCLLSFFGEILGVEWLGHMAEYVYHFKKLTYCCLMQFSILHSVYESSSSFTPHQVQYVYFLTF